MTDITILATTWLPPGSEEIRFNAFSLAMKSWQENLRYEYALHLHVSDDGTEDPYWKDMADFIRNSWKIGRVSFSRQPRKGLGASLNAGLIKCWDNSSLVFHAVDDWQLLAPLDLTPWVDFIQDASYEVDMVRFFGHPDLTGTIKHIPPHGWAIELDKHHYFFSFRPLLWHKRFFDRAGFFKDGVSALECENDINAKLKNFSGSSRIWMALPEMWTHLDPVSLSGIAP